MARRVETIYDVDYVPPEAIIIGDGRRPVKPETVALLAESIKAIGLRTPLTVLYKNDGAELVLVSGRHRLAACMEIGMEVVPVYCMTENSADIRLWEISENLHRAELTALERDEQIAEWLRLSEAKVVSDKLSETSKGGRPGLVTASSKAIGIHERDARRAVQVDTLSPEAKKAAVDLGLDDNRSALLKAAKETTPEAQVSRLKLAANPLNDFEAKEKQVARLMAAWNSASPEARDEFMSRIDTPVFDRGAA
jgi:ParB-like chromosome segregation protein Spo0J